MLCWNSKPHRWFQDLVEWSLYKFILECRIPYCLGDPPMVVDLGLVHMTDAELVTMCTALLQASKRERYYQPTRYQFMVLDIMLSKILGTRRNVARAAHGNILLRYFPPRPDGDFRATTPRLSDYVLDPVPDPPLNYATPSAEEVACLRTNHLGEVVEPPAF